MNNDLTYSLQYPVSSNDIATEHFDNFKGNSFTSFRGMTIWLPLVSGIAMANYVPEIAFGLIAVGVLFFCIFPFTMYYFSVSQHYLVIRNHIFFWMEKVYALDDIQEILLDSEGKQANKLTVVLKNFKTKAYQAGTLRDRHWLALKTRLESIGVKVRDEVRFKAETKGDKRINWILYTLVSLYFIGMGIWITILAETDWHPLIKILLLLFSIVFFIIATLFTVGKLSATAEKIDKQDKERQGFTE